MFRKYIKRQHSEPGAYQRGKHWFDKAVAKATGGDFVSALDLYTMSINFYPNPAAYLNRGRIWAKRLRYKSALDDLMEAQKHDMQQSREFLDEIAAEIEAMEIVTEYYRNGIREQLLEDFEAQDNYRHVAQRIFCSSFKVSRDGYVPYNSPLCAYHLFDDLDNIQRFEQPDHYPEATRLLALYSPSFIETKLAEPIDATQMFTAQLQLHKFLCCYDWKTMRLLRRYILHDIHERLLDRDYGAMSDIFDGGREDVIKQALIAA